ncbi:response regulator [Myxacorys almedinensis A]|uniref:Response regulator n=2 Tax=Myxacorys TaxID=2056239 RepID=A0A8J7Z0G8_9CYAN|nr:response regulator transcription factor [Myxacorys almedinensis]NDJ17982.1 response regulator [Myxacorys almedinensis A]
MIRILLVEDQEIVRRGLKTLLDLQPDLQVVAEAGNGQDAILQLSTLQTVERFPDVVLMDIRMPILDGVKATQQICQQHPDLKILMLTTFDDAKYISEALRFGAKGYLLKDTPAAELAEAVRSLHKGYTQFGPGILERLIAHVPQVLNDDDLPPGIKELTAREKEVLCLIAKGASNREIAQTLFLSEGTVRNHISHILTRLELRDRTQAAIVANTFLDYLMASGQV